MNLKHRSKLSFSVAIFFLKSVGYWSTTTRVEGWINEAMVFFSMLSVTFLMFVQTRGLYFYWGNLAMATYMGVNILTLVMDAFKMITLFIHKKKFFKLIAHMKEHFWHENYNQQESVIVEDTERLCKYFVYIFTFFCQSTVFCYCLRPIVGNIGRNESERELIFNMWLDLPLSMTPYYEITFTIQAVALYQIAVLYLCFDNIFCVMCLHVAGQFRVLQYRMSNMPMVKGMKNLNVKSTAELSKQCHVSFINYIEEHKALIEFCATLEEIFRNIILGQVFMFSILICILGYQVILVDLPLIWTISFALFLSANMTQLWMFTYSCDCVTQESLNIAAAVYAGPWIHLSMDKFGAMIRKNLEFVIMRSGRPSSLTASGFFPISLETYTKIMSTAMSYFTLLKQSSVDTTKA
ncbi:odorant receptor 13a-like [Ceratina calcarata]|uniref:Odorant receptor n=1 Tax=Ceratina calcarata TaxID=156304 RepID=A0AAJ7WG52_9HYME|nr:odorant receptor 13a-like [Ceratina calcarata]